MGIKNLTELNPSDAPSPHPEFFYPLSLKLDPEERAKFQTYFDLTFKEDVKGESLYSPIPNARDWFPKTVKQTDQLLAPIGLQVRSVTIFASDGNSTSPNIHVDGTRLKDDVTNVILEARLSYYEMAEAPGIIRWFAKTGDYVKKEASGKKYGQHWQLPWIQDLLDKKITWVDCPDYVHATSSNVPSGILRTNIPHHVIQGSGTRLTVSCQLVFIKDRNPVGVWEHIEKNIHLLGV